MASPLLAASHALAEAHHAQYDSSHDIHHVNRVVSLSLALARTLPAVDLLVVELAARFHDLLDAKYMPAGVPVPSARDHLRSFWDANDTEGETSGEQRALVEKVMENVSYSKEVKRIKAGAVTDWHRECLELHCVQDADKLDAIGAFGILRCAAYSGASSVPLYLPPSSSTSGVPPSGKSSAIDHFHEKLVHLEGMMKTQKGRELARGRTEFLKTFIAQTESEWKDTVEL